MPQRVYATQHRDSKLSRFLIECNYFRLQKVNIPAPDECVLCACCDGVLRNDVPDYFEPVNNTNVSLTFEHLLFDNWKFTRIMESILTPWISGKNPKKEYSVVCSEFVAMFKGLYFAPHHISPFFPHPIPLHPILSDGEPVSLRQAWRWWSGPQAAFAPWPPPKPCRLHGSRWSSSTRQIA